MEALRDFSAVPSPAGPLHVVVNGRAGTVRRRPALVEAMQRLMHGRGALVVTDDLRALASAMARARTDGAGTLVSCGGDGTHMELLSALRRNWGTTPWPRLLLLSGGTMNAAARHLGSAGRPDVVLGRLLSGVPMAETRHPLLAVNDRTGFTFGCGFITRLLKRYDATRTGPLACALLAARVIGSAILRGRYASSLFEPLGLSLSLDGRPSTEHRVSGLLASLVPSPAIGLRATPRAGEDGQFQLVAPGLSPAPLLREVPKLWLGLPIDALALDACAMRADLAFDAPLTCTLDGDLFEARHLRLEVTPPATFLHA